MKADTFNIQILYEDDDLLAVNKPSGLIVHSDGRTKEPSLSDWLIEKYPNIKKVGEPWRATDGSIIWRPGIVHRLDRETSGAILIDSEPVFHRKARREVGYVFQKDTLFPWRTVAENIGYGLELSGISKAERAERVAICIQQAVG